MDLSVRTVDTESQIFRKNVKFTFHAVKQQILRSFPLNAARILISLIYIFLFHKKNSCIRHLKKNSHFLCFIFFAKTARHDFFVAIFSTVIHKGNTKSHAFGFKKDVFQLLNPGINGNTYFRRYLIKYACYGW